MVFVKRNCTKVSMFWNELKVVLNSLNIIVRFDINDVLVGILDTDNISILKTTSFLKVNILFAAIS